MHLVLYLLNFYQFRILLPEQFGFCDLTCVLHQIDNLCANTGK